MTEPVLFGLPLSLAFLYFVTYSVLGWCMETTYCSILERRFVPRGFLYGPLCPIYGVGVLMMICWFQPLMDKPVLFYVVATVCMSAWEYFVGWFLETTTHIKYWDYSMYKFNLKGRICLWVCLMWGVLSFLILYFVHPAVSGLLLRIPVTLRYVLDGMLLGFLLSDTIATIYELVETTQLLAKVKQAGDELRVQAALGKAELSDKLEEARANLSDRLDDLLPDQLNDAARELKERYDELTKAAARQSRNLRSRYSGMTAKGAWADSLESVKRTGERFKQKALEAKRAKKAAKK